MIRLARRAPLPVALVLAAVLLPLAWSARATAQEPAVAAEAAVPRAPVTVVLVRHAEKATDDPRDPGLSAAGQERAARLARALAAAGVTHAFASEYRRTADTLAPLCEATGLELTRVPAREAEALVAALRALPAGAVAVVAGHSNTTPAIAARLGVAPADLVETAYGPAFPEDAYDRALVVTLGDGEGVAPKLLELRLP